MRLLFGIWALCHRLWISVEPKGFLCKFQEDWNSEMSKVKARWAFPKLKTTAKSVQTTAEVCADYTCSLYRLQLKSPESTMNLQIWVRALAKMSTRTYLSICVYLRKCLRCIHFREYIVLVSVISHGQECRPYRACLVYCRGWRTLRGERGMFTKKLRTSPPRGRLVRSVSL